MAKPHSLGLIVLTVLAVLLAITAGVFANLYVEEKSEVARLANEVTLLEESNKNMSSSLDRVQTSLATEMERTKKAENESESLRNLILESQRYSAVVNQDSVVLTKLYNTWYDEASDAKALELYGEYKDAYEDARRHLEDYRAFLQDNRKALEAIDVNVDTELDGIDRVVTAYMNGLQKMEEYHSG